MSLWQVFKVNRKTFINPGAWLNIEGVKEANYWIWDSVKDIFVAPGAGDEVHQETFEETIKRQKLTEANIKQTMQTYFMFAMFFLGLGAIVLLFSLYLLFFYYSLPGLILGIASGGLFLGQAFKYHFWYFQIKHRKLGCTLAEWWRGKVKEVVK